MKRGKKVILPIVLSEIQEGKCPAQISKKYNIKKQTLQHYIRYLKKNEMIKQLPTGKWEVLKEVSLSTKAHETHKQIRGHAFNWRIRFKHEIDWKRRLNENKIPFQNIGIANSTPRIIFKDKKIWFTKTGLVIYEPKSFYSQSSFTSKGLAVFELDRTIKELGRKLSIDISSYEFTTSREHYGMIKNELAKQYNDKGEKLYIRDDKGIWLWIDDSHSLSELEAGRPKESRGVQNWYNDMKKTNFEWTPTTIAANFNTVRELLELTTKKLNQSEQEIVNLKNQLKLNSPIDKNRPRGNYIG
jgi:predicted transcriptional regulator